MTDEELWGGVLNGFSDNILNVFGINPTAYRNVQGQSVDQFTSRWTGDLGSLGGYYDSGQVNSLVGGLGSTSSDTYLKQLSNLSGEANKLYTLINNPTAVNNTLYQKAQQSGGMLNLGLSGYRIDRGQGWSYDMMGNRYNDITASPIFAALYESVGKFSTAQNEVVSNLNAQQQREQGFVTQINQITQNATLSKSKAEQAAAQQALTNQYNQQQAALNQSAQANAAKLAEQQRQQDTQYAQAQQQAKAAAEAQQLQINKTALQQANEVATNAQADQTKAAAASLEQQAGAIRGGEAIVSTNAATKSKKGTSTRTERWQSTRTPAMGGGGINV